MTTTLETFYYNDKDVETFYSAFIDTAKSFGCNYIAYIYEDTAKKARVGFTSNPDWQEEYIGNNIIEKCHLWNAVSEHFIKTDVNQYILRWEDINAQNSHQKDIALYRKEMGIGTNGISFCTRLGEIREYLTFAPDINDSYFLNRVSENIETIKKHCFSFRKTTHDSIVKEKLKKNTPRSSS